MKRVGYYALSPAIFLLLLPPLSGKTQSSASENSPDVATHLSEMRRGAPSAFTAAGILSPSAVSDSAATDALTAVISTSGGNALWAGIYSAKLRTSVTLSGSTTSRQFLCLDDWSTTAVHYRRSFVGSSHPPRNHNGSSEYTVKVRSKDVNVREPDQASLLVGNFPAAAASMILGRSSYVAKLLPSRSCIGYEQCVEIYWSPSSGGIFVRQQEWRFRNKNGMPDVVFLRLPNLLGPTSLWESFHYKQFVQQGGVSIPGIVELQGPSGAVQTRTLISFVPNARFDTTAFDHEVGQ